VQLKFSPQCEAWVRMIRCDALPMRYWTCWTYASGEFLSHTLVARDDSIHSIHSPARLIGNRWWSQSCQFALQPFDFRCPGQPNLLPLLLAVVVRPRRTIRNPLLLLLLQLKPCPVQRLIRENRHQENLREWPSKLLVNSNLSSRGAYISFKSNAPDAWEWGERRCIHVAIRLSAEASMSRSTVGGRRGAPTRSGIAIARQAYFHDGSAAADWRLMVTIAGKETGKNASM
jgi:hypothetical protein